MSKLTKYTLIITGLNLLSVAIFLIVMLVFGGGIDTLLGWTLMFLSFPIVSVITQLIIAVVYLSNKEKQTISHAIFLSLGILVFAGFLFANF
jgi:ATP/ADP translocase